MFDIELPNDLSIVTDKALAKFSADIQTAYKVVTAETDPDAEVEDGVEAPSDEDKLAAEETLAGQFKSVKTELARRTEEAEKAQSDAAALAERRAKISSTFAEEEVEEEEEEVVEDPPAAEDEESDDSKGEASDKTGEELAVEQLGDAVASDDKPATTLSENNKSAVERAAALNDKAPAGSGVENFQAAATNESGFTAARTLRGFTAGETISFDQLAEAASQTHHNITSIKSDGGGVLLASSTLADVGPTVGGDEKANFTTIRDLVVETQEAHLGSNGLIASGAPCLPTKVDYSFFRLSSVQRPVEQALPRVSAPEGEIRFIAPPNWAYLSDGITIKTCDDEKVDPYVDKSVVTVDCPNTQTCCVSSISRIIEFNNLTFRAFKEFTAEAIFQLGVAFAEAKEQMYIDDIDAASVAVSAYDNGYGSNRNMFAAITTAAVGYRKRHRMRNEAPLTFMVSDLVKHVNAIDAFNDGRLSFGRDPEGTMRAYFSKLNINIVYTYHLASSATAAQGTDLYGAQAAAVDLNALPTEIAGYLYAPGTFIRMDAGQLDLGLVRDSILNRKNDLHLFAEQWTKVCKVGYESIKLPIAMCPNGAGAGDITPFTCP